MTVDVSSYSRFLFKTLVKFLFIAMISNSNHSFLYTTILAPLVVIDTHPESIATVVGIQSWVGACGDVNYPDVFGSVAQILPWIKQETGTSISS